MRAMGTTGPQTFTTLWTADQVRRVKRAGLEGEPLAITFGGPHLSAPSFRRAKVAPGDAIIPIQVRDGRLYVIGRMRVSEILDVATYVARDPVRFAPIHAHPEFVRLERYVDNDDARAFWLFRIWLGENPAMDALCPGEATEVVLPSEATRIRLDRVVPPSLVTSLRWQSGRQPERAIRHLGDDGGIERSISLQGIHRLTPASAEALHSLLVEGTPN